ncbi:AraC family transcriptional regulator [Acidovorax sp. LjRoot66]|uniref:AraC family transcriptional regulator n=1 Tax=Acidovorax sp. LjRoot66 TaxID=3342334 RepID=UPI003ECD23BB
MTPAAPAHQCQVFGSPWEGVYGTHIESSRHYGRHWHAVYGLGLLDQGAQSSASGRGTVDAYAGDLITTNPGEVHDGQPLGGPSRRWRMVYLEPPVLHAMAGDLASASPQGLALARPVIQNDTALRDALHQLLQRLAHWSTAPQAAASVVPLACEEALIHTCALLLGRHANAARLHAPAADASAEVRQVRDRLADTLLAPPTLTQLAAMTGLGKYQLLRRFTQAYGLPPHAWLLQQRAEHARHRVLRGASLADAAADCGFADQSHMTRIFARQFGFTPGAWQKATAGKARRPLPQ